MSGGWGPSNRIDQAGGAVIVDSAGGITITHPVGQAVTLGSTSVPVSIRMPSGSAGAGSFAVTVGGNTFSSVLDPTLYLGFNGVDGGAAIDSSLPIVLDSWEGRYETHAAFGVPAIERNFQMTAAGGAKYIRVTEIAAVRSDLSKLYHSIAIGSGSGSYWSIHTDDGALPTPAQVSLMSVAPSLTTWTSPFKIALGSTFAGSGSLSGPTSLEVLGVAATGGPAPYLVTLTGAAHTGLTSAQSLYDVYVNLSRTVTFASTVPANGVAGVFIDATALTYTSSSGSPTLASAWNTIFYGAPLVGAGLAGITTKGVALFDASNSSVAVKGTQLVMGNWNQSAFIHITNTGNSNELQLTARNGTSGKPAISDGTAALEWDGSNGIRSRLVFNAAFATATTASGAVVLKLGASGPHIYVGSGAPGNLGQPQGSLYLRTDGTTTNDRAYIANSTTTWTALTTAA